MEASLDLRSRDGTRRVALGDFLRGSWETTLKPGELVERIRIPVPRPSSYRWQRVRPANDISQVGVACALASSDGRSPWRIAAGGVEPHPQRLPGAEAALSHEDPSPGEIEEAVHRAVEGSRLKDDRRAGEEYRRHLLGGPPPPVHHQHGLPGPDHGQEGGMSGDLPLTLRVNGKEQTLPSVPADTKLLDLLRW
ncbi:molybdopterin dehydrogenase FAD-binding protein, partial [mine drainage metagenome]